MSGLSTTSGLSFGLSLAKPKKKGAGLKKRPLTTSSAFGGDDGSGSEKEEEEEAKLTYRERVNKELQEKAAASQAKMLQMQEKLKGGGGDGEDLDIYDYDGFASEKQRRVEQDTAVKKAEREKDSSRPQYIGNLMATAKVREKERELVHDKKMIKEREVEDQLYGDKPKFVTSAYKAKLEEDRKFEESEAAKEAQDDITRQQGLGSFLQNIHDGGGKDSDATKAPAHEEVYTQAESRKAEEIASRVVEAETRTAPEAEGGTSEKVEKWNQQVEEARGRYFLRKAAREAKGCWDL